MSNAADEARDMIGRTIGGKFVIESRIGSGAMGDVFLAKHLALDTHIALKVMHEELARDPRFAERFHREARAASKLNHPNSVRVIDFGEEKGTIYLAMELLSGRDLLKVLNEDWPVPPARIVAILSQSLGALAVAHDNGIIHRDLKPENIMIVPGKDDEGNAIDIVKVCDFGIAKISDSRSFQTEKGAPALTQTGSLIGTPEYMSPEQARGDSLDPRSDLYSMGIVLYQLLCGDLPFTGENALGVVLKVVTDDPRAPSSVRSGVHAGLEAVCMKAIAKTRNDRFQTAKEMRAALRQALGHSSLPGYPDSLSGPVAIRTSPFSGGPAPTDSSRNVGNPYSGSGAHSSGSSPANSASSGSSGGYPQAPSSQDALEAAMTSAPTLDLGGTAHASARMRPPAGPELAANMASEPSSAFPSKGPPKSTTPKDTTTGMSAGTALSAQVARRSMGGAFVVVLVAVLGLTFGVGVILFQRARTAKPTVAAATSASATDLNPLDQEQGFTPPLPNASGTSGPTTTHGGAGASTADNGSNGSNGGSNASGAHGAGKGAHLDLSHGSKNLVIAGPPGSAGRDAGLASSASSVAVSAVGANGAAAASSTAAVRGTGASDPAGAGSASAFNAASAHIEIGLVNPSGVKVGPLRKQFDAVRGQLTACYRDAMTAAGRRVDGAATFNLSIDTTGLISGVVVTGMEQLPQATRCFQTTLFHKQLSANALEGPGATAEVWVTLHPE